MLSSVQKAADLPPLCSMVNTASAHPAAIPGCQGGGQNKPFCFAHHHGSWIPEQPSPAKLHPGQFVTTLFRVVQTPGRSVHWRQACASFILTRGREDMTRARSSWLWLCRSCARPSCHSPPPPVFKLRNSLATENSYMIMINLIP